MYLNISMISKFLSSKCLTVTDHITHVFLQQELEAGCSM